MKKSAVILFLFSNLNCYNPVGTANTELDNEFDLKYGQKAVIGEEGLYITFIDLIEDSRCPINYDCIWQGNGGILLKIEKKHQLMGDKNWVLRTF